jgi:hypothetical protein
MAKQIGLYNIRPSTEKDEEGRVKTVILEFTITSLSFIGASFSPIFTKDGYSNMGKLFPTGQVQIKTNAIYNSNGSIYLTMEDWTKSLNYEYSLDDEEKEEISGKADFNEKYLKISEQLIGIKGINYKVPIQRSTEKVIIQQDGKACVYVKNEEGTVDTLLTDLQLKSIVFDKDTNEININGKWLQ